MKLNKKLGILLITIFSPHIIQGLPASSGRKPFESFRGIIPFSSKYPEQVIPDESVCLPRITCEKKYSRSNFGAINPGLAWTDGLSNVIGDGPQDITTGQDEDQASGPIDLPPEDEELETSVAQNVGPLISAVVAEPEPTFYVEQSQEECAEDKEDYCDKDGEVDYLSSKHTMCKYCGIGEKCPFYINADKNDLTGRKIVQTEVKELIVQLHNEVRSKIARGACDQPKAGCMGPVVWDDELARVAQKWADQCADVDYKDDYKRKDPHLFHDPHPNRKVEDFSDWRGVGQNVARDISKGRAGKFNATRLVGHWFRQIRLFDPQGVREFGSGEQCSLGVGYYTQLVWQETTHVGCGWSQFQYRGFAGYYENFLVCNYGPAANIWKDKVYDIAEDTCDCPCVDCHQDVGMCPANPRFASWTSWSGWSRCSQSCGSGRRDRKRECRAPREGGGTEPSNLCPGEDSEQEACNRQQCPAWTRWSAWSGCSVTCGEGERRRKRTCDLNLDRNYGEKSPCPGLAEQVETCEAGTCPAWTEWTDWTQCSQSCGGGIRSKVRECVLPKLERERGCIGEAEVKEECNNEECPVWTEWTEWTMCTKTCGGGTRTKVRKCVLPKTGEVSPCNGEAEVTEDCNGQTCPVWTDWTEWTQCTKSCGGGKKSRTRDCVLKKYGGKTECQGDDEETVDCNKGKCPVWTDWTEWTECSATCGGGSQMRARECVLPKSGVQGGCPGDNEKARVCNSNECPVWTDWTKWTECTVTCGGGTRFKVRECVFPNVRGVQQCPGPDKLTEACNADNCPVLTEWGAWTECSKSCGGGTRTKYRKCVNGRDGNNNPCQDELELTESCNKNVCPEYTGWSDWTQCTKTCGGGLRKKVRECVLPKGVDGCIGGSEMEEGCNEQECPIWTEWTDWTECTKSCGGGTQRRVRDCVLPETRGILVCTGKGEEERECGTGVCPLWTDWTEWTTCSQSCGGGTRSKVRECYFPTLRGVSPCQGESEVTEDCNPEVCPVWTEWTDWTACTKTCGGGKRSKVRECVLPKYGEQDGCDGDKEVTEDCNDKKCPIWTNWTDWTSCTKSCGGGLRSRSRDCVEQLYKTGGQTDCEGDQNESESCSTVDCPVWSPWSKWSECSKTCGEGLKSRSRRCEENGEEGSGEASDPESCNGPKDETTQCHAGECPEWTQWTDWSQCSRTCGEGRRSRQRSCVAGEEDAEGKCPGDGNGEEECKEKSCPVWSEWGQWSSCSETCGQGIRERGRECGTELRFFGLKSYGCPGQDSESGDCDGGDCYNWGRWGAWSECSASCGGGIRTRERECSKGGVTIKLGLQFGLPTESTCPGPSQEEDECNNQQCKPPPVQQGDCDKLNLPVGFFSFSGKPAKSIVDCTWDFFSCTKQHGSWPRNKECCDQRFQGCCDLIMGGITTNRPPAVPSRPPGSNYGPEQQGYPGSQQEQVYPSNQGQGYPGATQEYPGSQQVYPGQGQQVYPGQGQQVYPGQGQQVYPGQGHVDHPGEDTGLINCVWSYMGCTSSGVPEKTCRKDFKTCSDAIIAHGGNIKPNPPIPQYPGVNIEESGSDHDFTGCVTRYYGCSRGARDCKETFDNCAEEVDQIDIDIETDIDLPNLENPIDDIDLGNGTGVDRPQNIKPDKPVVNPIRPQVDPENSEDKEDVNEGKPDRPEGNTDSFNWGRWGAWTECSASCGGGIRTRERECSRGGVTIKLGLQFGLPTESTCPGPSQEEDECNNQQCKPPPVPEISAVVAEEDDSNPVMPLGSGKVPEIQCMWSYFKCSKEAKACKKDHKDCVDGNLFDNQICAGVSQNPRNYLVGHPSDCSRYYSCSRQSSPIGSWTAHPMQCPAGTGFHKELGSCTFFSDIPDCNPEGRIIRGQDDVSIVARQTRQNLEVGDLGYLTSGSKSQQITGLMFSASFALLYLVL